MSLEIVRIWFVMTVGAAGVVLCVATWRLWPKRRRMRFVGLFLAVLLVVVTALAGVNSYFQYFPTFGTLLGSNRDAASLKSIHADLGGAHDANPALKLGITLPAHGKVVKIPIPATASHFGARAAEVYLPPRWFMGGTAPLPVIELFHGTPGTPEDWVRGGGVQDEADKWASKNDGYAPVFIMPDLNGTVLGDSECVDGKQGNAETYLTTDVRNFAIQQLHTAQNAESWAVGGLSEGGYCSAMLTLRHPDLFSVFMDFGGEDHATSGGGASDLFVGNAHEVATKARQYNVRDLIARYDRNRHLAGWFIAGSGDPRIARISRELSALSAAAGIDSHELTLGGGHHTFDTWKRSLANAFPFTATTIGASPPAVPAQDLSLPPDTAISGPSGP